MDQRRAIIVVSIVVALILFLIGGTIFYLARVFNSGSSSDNSNPVVTSHDTSRSGTSPSKTGNNLPSSPANTLVYKGPGFTLSYPKTWSVLTCTNSDNLEFDPAGGQNQSIVCDKAREPITILVNKGNTCSSGNLIKTGAISARKVVTQTSTGVNYEWCTMTTPKLDVTERVSSAGSRATSANDYSTQVEQMLSTFSKVTGS